MRIVKVLYTFCIGLTIIPIQCCCSSEIACANRAYDVMDIKVQTVVANHFQCALANEILDIQKGLFKTAVYYKDKFIADKFMQDKKWISLTNSMKNISPIVLNVLSKQINMLNKLIEKEWARYRIDDIIQFSAKKKALIISTTMPLTRAFKLIGSINPSVSFENAIFWMFLNVEEDAASDFEKIGYITCLANALGKYKAVTNDQDVQPTIDSLQNICIAMLNGMAEEQQRRASTPSIPDKKYMNKQYKMQSEMPRNQYQKLKQD